MTSHRANQTEGGGGLGIQSGTERAFAGVPSPSFLKEVSMCRGAGGLEGTLREGEL